MGSDSSSVVNRLRSRLMFSTETSFCTRVPTSGSVLSNTCLFPFFFFLLQSFFGKHFLNKTLKFCFTKPKYGWIKCLVRSHNTYTGHLQEYWRFSPSAHVRRYEVAALGISICLWESWGYSYSQVVILFGVFIFASKVIPSVFPDSYSLDNVSTKKNNDVIG